MRLNNRRPGPCLYGKGGRLASISLETAEAIGLRACPKPEVLKSRGAHHDTCAGCLDALRTERRIIDPTHPIPTLADMLAH